MKVEWSLPEKAMLEIPFLLKNKWLGLILKYDDHWGEGEKPPLFMVKENTECEEFMRAVENEIIASGDDHHVFIERLEPQGMWLRITTGS